MNIIVIGLVAPLGTDKDDFIEHLQANFERYNYKVEPIKITDELLFKKKLANIPRTFEIYLKMQICSEIRKNLCSSFMACLVINKIKEICNKKKNSQNIVFIVDEIKHLSERRVLRHVFGNSYIQVSLFSSPENRQKNINDTYPSDDKLASKILKCKFKKLINKMHRKHKRIVKGEKNTWTKRYFNLTCAVKHLLKKDLTETHKDYKKSKSGQQIEHLFHLSHFYFTMDTSHKKMSYEINKFTNLLYGEHKELPTQDEFGIQLAHQASLRSNFPGDRQIGSCIISEHGEVITASGIKSPSNNSNPKWIDRENVEKGYKSYKIFIEKISEDIEKNKVQDKYPNIEFEKLIDLNKNSLDFHPSTHGEISAILNAAKLGTSIRNATMYVTTYPCHICLKDIINSGIKKVIYIEEYPKSKNEELYPKDLIEIKTFEGVGPRRYHYVYDERYHLKKNKEKLPPYTKFETYKYLELRIKDITEHYKCILNRKKKCSHTLSTELLNKLMGVPNNKKN